MTDADAMLPAPLVPAYVDLRDFQFMPLDVDRLRDSDLAAQEAPESCWAAVLLWCASWHQVPAASLPDDDRTLSNLAGYGRVVTEWKRVRNGALRGWVLCSDKRLYHPVVAEKAIEGWRSKLEHAFGKECDRMRKAGKRNSEAIQLPTFDEWCVRRMSGGNTALSGGQNRTVSAHFKNSQVIHSLLEPDSLSSVNSVGQLNFSSGQTQMSGGQLNLSGGIPAENALKGQGQGDLREEPLPLGKGFGVALSRSGRRPRPIRRQSLRMWLDLVEATDHVHKTGPPLDWSHVGKALSDRNAFLIGERIGYRVIAERTRFTKRELRMRFREMYEQLLEREATPA